MLLHRLEMGQAKLLVLITIKWSSLVEMYLILPVTNTRLFYPADPDPVPQASPAAECGPTAVIHGGPSHQLVFPQNEG